MAIYVTVVTNTSGATKYFGFLPPHGAELDNGERYVINSVNAMTIFDPYRDGPWRRTRVDAFTTAVDDGDLSAEMVNITDALGSSSSSSSSLGSSSSSSSSS